MPILASYPNSYYLVCSLYVARLIFIKDSSTYDYFSCTKAFIGLIPTDENT